MSGSPLPASRGLRRRRITAGVAALATTLTPTLIALTAAPASAASVTSAAFSGGAGTYTASNGTVFAKQGAALTLTVHADNKTECVRVTSGSSSVERTGAGTFTFSSGLQILTAGSGNGLVPVTVSAFANANGKDKCVANQGETFMTQPSYTLDNAAPTATAARAPAPNGAGWNKADVTLTWTGTDTGGSGIRTVEPTRDMVTEDGIATKTATVTDNVGNTGTSSVQVKLDKTAPSITGSRTPAANRDGWNNTDVTVSFTPSDATSGVKSSSAPTTLSTSGADQAVTGTVVDNADNSASTTVGDINIDKVAPTLAGRPTTNSNAAGWYRGDVTVAWTASDALSGTSNPPDSTIGGEGAALTASATATDKAGNTSGSVQSPAVRIDRTAPNTTVTAPPAWNKTDVTLTLVPNDGLSGVDKTYYTLDGGARVEGTSVPVTAEGNHVLRFWTTDVAGNTEAAHEVRFGIDKTSPTIGHTQNPAANADGWNDEDVTVTFACDDAVSGVASCTDPRTVTTEGKGQLVTGTVEDNAGNTATDPASVSIDKTAPVITVDALPKPNASGWYRDDVTATFTAADALSGVKTQDDAHTFGEGADQTTTATATDAAGNRSSVTTSAVNVDKTAPTLTGKVVGTKNANGWFTGDVVVEWTCDDTLSGVVACPADSLVEGEGSDLSATASVTDKAGHTAVATVDGIKIDRTAPTTTATDVPAGWVNAPVTVVLTANDNLSDVDSTYYAVDGATTPTKGNAVTVGEQGTHTVEYWSVDGAGNKEDVRTFTVKVDLSSPSITPSQTPEQNPQGWNNTDVSVSFACADQTDLSGLKDCTEPVLVTTEGRAQEATGTASDHAGNTATGTATVNVDRTAPTITGAADRPANAAGWYRDDVTVSFQGEDGLSGIAGVTGPQRLSEGADQTVDGSAADNAGNTASTTVSGINVDKTAPILSAAPTTSPNRNGWYNSSVTQVWAADDALSGLAGQTPADAVLVDEGEGQTVSATAADKAGNTTSATSAPVKIDKTAPRTNVSAPSGWVNDSAKVVLSPHDALSGVAVTTYTVNGGEQETGTEVTLSREGTHTLAPAANGNGWNNADVTVTFICADQDELSGIASCTEPQRVTTEGKDQPVTGTATDRAGNTATDPATVSLDKTEPTITGSRTPAANAHGWNNTDVTVSFDGRDALSGIRSVTADKTFGEGTNQSHTGTAVDAADNAASAAVGQINVDQTHPTLSGKPVAGPNANGWYRGDVTIDWTAGDDRSGVATAPADTAILGEGRGLKDTATVTDKAGNSTTEDSVAVNIDRTAPATGADAPDGWNNTAVTVSLEAGDGLSGVAATYYKVDGGAAQEGSSLTIDAEGVHALQYWSVDRAGNTEAARTATVKIDLTDPTVAHTVTPRPNGGGWNNTPVTVAYQCDDELSKVARCTPATEVTSDGEGQVVPGTAVDNAGNAGTVEARVSIDTVKPTITGAPDRVANPHGWYAGEVTVRACAEIT